MVSVVNGLLASTFWRVVSGSNSHSGGCDKKPDGRQGAHSKIRQMIDSLNCQCARFVRKSLVPAHDCVLGSKGVSYAHICQDLGCGRDGVKPQNVEKSGEQESDPDWVIFDLPSVSAVPCGKSDKVFVATTPRTTSLPLPGKVTGNENEKKCILEFDMNRFCLSKRLTKPKITEVSGSTESKNEFPPSRQVKFKEDEINTPTNEYLSTKQPKITTICDCAPGQDSESLTRTCAEVTCIETTCCTSKSALADALVYNAASRSTASNTAATNNIAIPGNYRTNEAREAPPKQCVSDECVSHFDKWAECCVNCHAITMATPNETKDKAMEGVTTSETVSGEDDKPTEPKIEPLISPTVGYLSESPVGTESTVTETGSEASNNKAGFGTVSSLPSSVPTSIPPSVGYREDIRAYDIYRIKPNQSTDAHYSRLPSALPTLTDSDSDPDEARWRQGIRKRKRRTSGRKGGEGESGKRYREEEETDDEDGSVGLDDITVYTSPSIEDYTNRISVLHRLSAPSSTCENAQRRVSFSLSTSTSQHHSSTSPSTSNTVSYPPTTIPPKQPITTISPLKIGDNDDVCSDGDASSNNDDDDDDDEASTVVPDDFDDDTDSDIEVLGQSESWVDLSNQPEVGPDRVTPLPFGNGEETIRLLREAQKESNHSSARVSLASSRRDTPRDSPHDSPKSPPNSPNTELTTDPEEAILKGVYINYYNKEGDFIRVEKNTETDWIWDWSSRPDQSPPKEWRFAHPGKGVKRGASIRRVMVGNSSLFSRDVLYTLLITNVLSLIIGTGIGIWLSKRSSTGAIVTLPIN